MDMQQGNDSIENKIHLRHSCGTKYLASINNQLTAEQKLFIEGTCFGWLTMLKEPTKLSRNLLSKLCSRWDDKSGCFQIRSQSVRFTLLDVCVGLGLRVVGPKFNLNEIEVESNCRKMFQSKNVDLSMLYDFLMRNRKEISIPDFCRVYILLGICEFLLPNRIGRVFPILFKRVDDIEGLGNLNWGVVVYEYLVGSICRASFLFKRGGTKRHFHVDRCVYLLQLWAYDHLLMWSQKGRCLSTKFPRVLHWMNVKVGDFVISRSFNKNLVVFDVVASPEEFGYVIVREAFEAFGRGFSEKTDVTNNDGLELAVDQQEQLIDELEAQLKELKRHIVDRTGEFNEGSGGCSHPSHEYFDDIIGDGVADVNGCCSAQHSYSVFGKDMDHDEEVQKAAEFDNEDTNEYEESNMYDRMKHQPRLRLKSARIRTLFATYQRRKFRK